MKVKRFVGFAIFLSILIAVSVLSYHIISWKDTDGTGTTVFQGLYETEENLIDVLFLGSSHCYCTVNNAQLWEDYGYSTFNMAISGQDMASTYYSFREVLKTQKPKIVMVEMCYAAWYGYEVEGNLFRNLLNYRFSKNYLEAVRSLVTEEKSLDVLLKLPLIHTRYKELNENDFNFQKVNHRGYVPVFHTQPVYNPIFTLDGPVEPIRTVTQEWMDKILDMANDNQIEVVFFLAPYSADEADKAYFRSVHQYSEQKQIPFLNFLTLWNEVGLNEEVDFADFSHVNYLGAEKVTEYIGNYLEKHYDLVDHRSDKNYVLWDNFSDVIEKKINGYELSKTTEFTAYMKQIKKHGDNQIIILSVDGDATFSKSDEKKLKDTFGLKDTPIKNGTWVFQDQELLFTTKDAKEYFYQYSYGKLDLVLKGYFEGASEAGYYKDNYATQEISELKNLHDCLINKQKTEKVLNGINIVVYDMVLEEIVDKVGFVSGSDLQIYRYDDTQE